ncbi:MAG: DUF4011 domain-containing protein, partial [Planctomycetota bacterium]
MTGETIDKEILAKLNKSRKELLDLGLRNPLVNYRGRTRKIDIVDERSAQLFDILVKKNKEMTFLPIPEKKKGTEGKAVSEDVNQFEPAWDTFFAEQDEDVGTDGVAARHQDTRLQTKLPREKLHKTLLNIHNFARTLIGEQGVNVLYMALGFLHWYESKSSEIMRCAPLLLVPVALTRKGVNSRFVLSYTGEEIGSNLSLFEKMKTEFGFQLPAIEDGDTLITDDYFKHVEASIKAQTRWEVCKDEIVLDFFSFGKFLMYSDLATDQWPEEEGPENHALLQALLGNGFHEPADQISDNARIDDYLNPTDIRQVKDADSTQTLAILDVNKGHNLVIQGPPGTGKSQTITNIIAESISAGKKVLFVAEKMAALDVVKRRLDEIGLGDTVLELHSHKTKKRTFLQELERTLNLGKPKLISAQGQRNILISIRDSLNTYCEEANTPIRNSGITPVQAFGSYLNLGDDANRMPRLDFSKMCDWSEHKYKEQRIHVENIQRCLKRIGIPMENVFWGTRLTSLLPMDEAPLRDRFDQIITETEDLSLLAKELADSMKLEKPDTIHETQKLIYAAEYALSILLPEGVRLERD